MVATWCSPAGTSSSNTSRGPWILQSHPKLSLLSCGLWAPREEHLYQPPLPKSILEMCSSRESRRGNPALLPPFLLCFLGGHLCLLLVLQLSDIGARLPLGAGPTHPPKAFLVPKSFSGPPKLPRGGWPREGPYLSLSWVFPEERKGIFPKKRSLWSCLRCGGLAEMGVPSSHLDELCVCQGHHFGGRDLLLESPQAGTS